MNVSAPTLQELLHQVYEKRKHRNTKYTISAYARDLKIHPATLSAVLKGRRKLPLKYLSFIQSELAEKNNVIQNLTQKWLESRSSNIPPQLLPSKNNFVLSTQNHFELITEWEYFAVLNLVKTKSFIAKASHVARRLGISLQRSEKICQNLINWNFLKVVQSKRGIQWLRCHPPLRTTDGKLSHALRLAHANELQLIQQRIMNMPVEFSDFSSVTFAANSKKLEEAKVLIRNFRQKLAQVLENSSELDSVYLFSVNLLPLTTEGKSQK